MIIVLDSANSRTLYVHLNKIVVKVRDKVDRGSLIGFSGCTGSEAGPIPHLHFNLNIITDPYRDLANPSSTSYWTKDNDPQYP
jgi:murein DD-endopeptidase MepM/ murein hydrolase activator NlpD